MEQFLSFLGSETGRFIITLLLALVVIAILVILCRAVFRAVMSILEEKKEEKSALRTADFEKLEDADKGRTLRELIAPDGVDPAPNSYMVISDSGRDIYVRSFTITTLPKNTTFARTFAGLMDFTGCTSSVFVVPIPEGEMSRKLNKHITVVDSEIASASGNPNRQRQLSQQYSESMRWARELETGDNKFFNVGFLFSIYANSVSELNSASDEFRTTAKSVGIEISACFACQPEAYQANAPLNRVNMTSEIVKGNAIKYFMMDKYSVSDIYNYTQTTFTHRTGTPLGWDLFTHKPVIFDIFNHDSFIGIIYGPVGYGKSASIKMLAARNAAAGYRFAAIDSQPLKGTGGGEYNPLCRVLNGTIFQLSPESKNVLNLFDVSVSKTFESDDGIFLGIERETLKLTEKISLVVDNLLTILQSTKEFQDAEIFVRIGRILTDACVEIYEERGIYDRKPESLYEEGSGVTSGKVLKDLPTMSDFYKRIVKKFSLNTDESLDNLYRFIIDGFADYVKPLYYLEKSATFISKEEYERIQPNADGLRIVMNTSGETERVIAVRGTNTYFDGQSTISRDFRSPFINIDISQLPNGTKKDIARQVALSWVNESIINKNSEDMKAAEKVMIIFDEAHENFKISYGRKIIAEICRTARKRHCGMLISTQTISEFGDYPETKKILDLASFHFIFAQPASAKDDLKTKFGLTDSQINYIVNVLGSGGANASPEEIRKHQGEFCLYDREYRRCAFIKFMYFKNSKEAMIAETNAEKVEKMFKRERALAKRA